MSKQIFSALRITALALVLSFGVSYVYAWVAPTVTPPGGNVSAPINTSATAQYKDGSLGVGGLLKGYGNIQAVTKVESPQYCIGASCITSWPTGGGVTPPAGSEFLNTSATAQTKAGWLKAVGGNGGDPASRIGVGNNWWMSENTNGNYAIHRNGVGDKLTMDTNGNVGLSGSITATSLNTGGAVTAGTVTASGALTAAGLTTTNRLTVSEAGGAYTYITMKDDESPNGVKYIHANSNVVGFLSGYGGWLSYWDNSGNQQNIGRVTATEVCTTAGKCLSAAGGGTPSIGVYSCPVGKTPGVNPWGGAWGYYGCAGQVSTISYCTNIEYPWSENRGCTYLGALRIN